MPDKIASIHIPKTAGTSFKKVLEGCYKDKLGLDYFGDWATLFSQISDGEITCVHGHYTPHKYSDVPNIKFITWVREPVSRLWSHYRYWRENTFPENSAWQRMSKEDWSFEKFATSRDPEICCLIGRFLDGLDVSETAFLGIVESYERSLWLFSQVFGFPDLEVHTENASTPIRIPDLPESLLRRIKLVHAEDFQIYEEALSLFSLRYQVAKQMYQLQRGSFIG